MEFIQESIVAVRTIRSELNISPSLRLKALMHPADAAQATVLQQAEEMIRTLARLESLTIDSSVAAPKASASNVVQGCQIIVPLSGAVDLQGEMARLDKEMGKLDKELVSISMKLANESFVERAPAAVVQRERDRAEELADARSKLEVLRARFAEALEE